MADRRGRATRGQRVQRHPPTRRWLPFVIAAFAIVAVLAFFIIQAMAKPGQVVWANLGTEDAHSLAFVDGDPQHLLFGHHGGISQSLDGGRTWTALPVRQDAMSMTPATNGSIVIAGHDVFSGSSDGGATWAPIAADLPNLDIHGFTRDPADPARMWAYLATGGLWRAPMVAAIGSRSARTTSSTRWPSATDPPRPCWPSTRPDWWRAPMVAERSPRAVSRRRIR